MRPYYYSDFLSNYVKVFFTDKNYPLELSFLDELYHFIALNKEQCINKYGEFLESTIHSKVVLDYLLNYYTFQKNDVKKYQFLYEFMKTIQSENHVDNLLADNSFAFRMFRSLYETHAMN
jgi:hypothetical protein